MVGTTTIMAVKTKILHFLRVHQILLTSEVFIALGVTAILTTSVLGIFLASQKQRTTLLYTTLKKTQKDFIALKNVDQYKRNNELQATIKSIEDTYTKSVKTYEALQDLKTQTKDTSSFDTQFANILSLLSQRNYSSASATLDALSKGISDEQTKLAQAAVPAAPQATMTSNTPPGSGYSRQSVSADTGTFVVDIIAADLNSTRVIVDTASDGDCSNNCPVLPLGTYVSRSGAYAGINGTFFCPPEYPSCAGKTNSFDTLLMNKNKVYFNSANNVYSVVPLVYFTGNTMGVRAHTSDWGRATDVDSVIAMQPLLIMGGNIVYGDSSDTKFTNKGTRSFIAHKGSTVYIGVMYNANMTDSAHVMKALGMDDAMNLDEGGSTALLFNGSYIAGPGRNIPNAVLFMRK